MINDIVPCKKPTAEHILSVVGSERYASKVPQVARQTANFPSEWTKDNGIEFTRGLRECDQRVFEHVVRSAKFPVAHDILDVVGDMQLPFPWLAAMQYNYHFLHKCLDLGQPVDPSKIPGADRGHFAVVMAHPNATQEILKGAKLLKARLYEEAMARERDQWVTHVCMTIFSCMVVMTFWLMLVYVTQPLMCASPEADPCPAPEPCPGLESYRPVELLQRLYDISNPADIIAMIAIAFLGLLSKILETPFVFIGM